ncbi:unnamed protein product, partial [Linum tenue]
MVIHLINNFYSVDSLLSAIVLCSRRSEGASATGPGVDQRKQQHSSRAILHISCLSKCLLQMASQDT